MQATLVLFFVCLVLLFLFPKDIGMLLNKPLGILVSIIFLCYFTYQHPVLGIAFVLFVLFTRNITTPLDISYHTVPQTPATTMREKPLYYTGLEQLTREMNLRSKDSNRYSIVQGISSSCKEGDLLCLYENIPKAFDEKYANKKNIL